MNLGLNVGVILAPVMDEIVHFIDHWNGLQVLVTHEIACFQRIADATKQWIWSWVETIHISLCSSASYSCFLFFFIKGPNFYVLKWQKRYVSATRQQTFCDVCKKKNQEKGFEKSTDASYFFKASTFIQNKSAVSLKAKNTFFSYKVQKRC